jgi:hypothetical protein
MSTFLLAEGPPGQGKSLYTARITRNLAERNLKWHAQGRPLRHVYSNLQYKEEFEQFYSPAIKYWRSLDELTTLYDVDIVWDEIATELDSRSWAMLSHDVLRMLSQYRKRGLDIYANTQDFNMVDSRARIMFSEVVVLRKVIGSPDPSASKPVVKHPWGLIMKRDLYNFRRLTPETKREYGFPGFFTIRSMDCDIYDTRQDITATALPKLRHVVQYCEHHDDPSHPCVYEKISHK